MYVLHGHARYFKFKQKYEQRGPCFQTIFPFSYDYDCTRFFPRVGYFQEKKFQRGNQLVQYMKVYKEGKKQ